ncbi:MAG TPA: hypothetical protein ENG09_03595 [Candidatus Syntrophoarchaeum butanivorans]|uniref:SpoVT/AbrB-like, predicted transcription regulator domain protein n=1 Tax=Candidatus Syntropharchaeum butanivorans TaxID=1839936 RepID=A0A1F2P603_9EURY|nr:MAG: SpoVT/AbrB-like, predicted transcription regulator domain protein [Candidatus Syntrophoarchaeum butanivorans]RJS71858.1 MAG: hypothetical protein CW694_04260 [Candidatus Syntrophoarchaeum sp. WYZ-LMO15]HDM36322.1 hypothetical protein [Candidatus Syntrophoarchaeum butanivorans]HEC57654.1 hypothetical protein [Candidatus Syntrophoarchaeum butanivorans]
MIEINRVITKKILEGGKITIPKDIIKRFDIRQNDKLKCAIKNHTFIKPVIANNRITIPIEIREILKLKKGDMVDITIESKIEDFDVDLAVLMRSNKKSK